MPLVLIISLLLQQQLLLLLLLLLQQSRYSLTGNIFAAVNNIAFACNIFPGIKQYCLVCVTSAAGWLCRPAGSSYWPVLRPAGTRRSVCRPVGPSVNPSR